MQRPSQLSHSYFAAGATKNTASPATATWARMLRDVAQQFPQCEWQPHETLIPYESWPIVSQARNCSTLWCSAHAHICTQHTRPMQPTKNRFSGDTLNTVHLHLRSHMHSLRHLNVYCPPRCTLTGQRRRRSVGAGGAAEPQLRRFGGYAAAGQAHHHAGARAREAEGGHCPGGLRAGCTQLRLGTGSARRAKQGVPAWGDASGSVALCGGQRLACRSCAGLAQLRWRQRAGQFRKSGEAWEVWVLTGCGARRAASG